MQIQYSQHRRGTVLVLVVVLLALLAIMGTSFVISMRIEGVAAENRQVSFAERQTFQASLESVETHILDALEVDLWGQDGRRLLGTPEDADPGGAVLTNEPWDAPGPAAAGDTATFWWFNGVTWEAVDAPIDGDPWLASSETYEAGGVFFWSAMTDIRTLPDWLADPVDPAGIPGYVGAEVNPADPLQSLCRADADGDGISDANWKDLGLINGARVRAAIRIVDTCGMVNLNTAWRWPGPSAAWDAFRGDVLSGVMCYGNGSAGDGPAFALRVADDQPDRIPDLPGRISDLTAWGDRDGSGFANDFGDWMLALRIFHDAYAMRIDSSVWTDPSALPEDWEDIESTNPFVPLDISDEMELRGDGEPNSLLEMRCTDVNLSRPMLTSHSFTRGIRRNLQTEPVVPGGRVLDGNGGNSLRYNGCRINVAKSLREWMLYYNKEASNIYYRGALPLGLFRMFKAGAADIDGATIPLTDEQAAYLSAQYLANLLDALDDDNDPTILTAADFATLLPDWGPEITQLTGGHTYVGGLEKHPVISEMYAFRVRAAAGETQNAGDRYAIELYNPWDVPLPLGGYCYSVDGGVTHGEITAGTPLAPGGYLVICNNADILDAGVTSFVDSTLVLPDAGNVILYREVTRDTVDYDVVVDYAECVLQAATPFEPPIDPNDPADLGSDGYTWDWIKRDNTPAVAGTIEWLCFTDHQERTGDSTTVSHGDPAPAAPPMGGDDSLGTDNGITLNSATVKGFSFWIPDSIDYVDWESPVGRSGEWIDWEQRRRIQEVLTNPGAFSLVPYYGDLVEASITLPVSRPLSYRLRDLAVGNEHGIRISFVDQLGAAFQDIFEIPGRSSDGVDQNGDGVLDDPREMRLPGLINVNTAPSRVLQAIHPYLDSARADAVSAPGNLFKNVSDLLSIGTISAHGSDTTDELETVQGVSDDLEEAQMLWARFANLITTRSDTFAAYILIEADRQDGSAPATERWVLLLDRSECCEAPFDSAGAENPAYQRPKVVFRHRIE